MYNHEEVKSSSLFFDDYNMITIDSDETLEIYICTQGLISLKRPSEILEMMKIFQVPGNCDSLKKPGLKL